MSRMPRVRISVKFLRSIHKYLTEHLQEKQYAPSIVEIVENTEPKSVATVHRYLNLLNKYGYIRRVPRKSRALAIVVAYRLGLNYKKVLAGERETCQSNES